MHEQEDHIELIEKYHSGAMTTEELADFESKLASDDSFRTGYEHHLDTLAALKTYHFKKEVSEFHKEFIGKEANAKNIWIYLSGVAASILIVAVSFYFFSTNPAPDSKMLFASNFEPYPNLIKVRGEDDLLSKAFQSYADGNYSDAISTFHQLGESERVNLYLGVSYMVIGNFQKAKVSLEKLSENSIYKEQATWYLALLYLAVEDTEQVMYHLDQISPSHYKYKEAKKLIADLD